MNPSDLHNPHITMKRHVGIALFALVAVVLVSACGSSEQLIQSGEDLVPQLENEGLTLMAQGVSNLQAFSVTGQEYQVGAGGTLHIYEYTDENRAALEASRIDAGILTDANVYRHGNIIAVYFGQDYGVNAALSNVLGARVF